MNRVFPSAILFVFMLTGLSAQPQSTICDAVILKNGTSVVGTLVASTHDSIRIQTGEGNLLVFHKKEVVARTKETVLPTYIPLKIYDVLGREVATIFDGEVNAGYYQRTTFDASRLAPGIYIARLQHGGKQLLQKLVLMR